jgi:putative ABC transport system permease protein
VSVLGAWLRVALVDLRGDLRRFGVLLACLALGVATIAIVGSVGAALQSALNRDARQLLGADLQAGISYRLAEPAERQLFETLGTVAEVVQVMGNGVIGEDSVFLTLRAVGENYPLVGTVDVGEAQTPGASLQELLTLKDGAWGIVADNLLEDRLGVKVGDRFTIDNQTFELRGIIAGVPDQMTQGFNIGIPTFIAIDALTATNILTPGVLAQYQYKIRLDVPFDEAKAKILAAFPDAGWKISSPQDATADLGRFFDVFARFLTIVGLSALIVGGVGVSNAIAAYVTERQRSIATLKALGATSGRILTHFLTQVLAADRRRHRPRPHPRRHHHRAGAAHRRQPARHRARPDHRSGVDGGRLRLRPARRPRLRLPAAEARRSAAPGAAVPLGRRRRRRRTRLARHG